MSWIHSPRMWPSFEGVLSFEDDPTNQTFPFVFHPSVITPMTTLPGEIVDSKTETTPTGFPRKIYEVKLATSSQNKFLAAEGTYRTLKGRTYERFSITISIGQGKIKFKNVLAILENPPARPPSVKLGSNLLLERENGCRFDQENRRMKLGLSLSDRLLGI